MNKLDMSREDQDFVLEELKNFLMNGLKYVIQEFRMNDEMKKLTVRAVNQVIIG